MKGWGHHSREAFAMTRKNNIILSGVPSLMKETQVLVIIKVVNSFLLPFSLIYNDTLTCHTNPYLFGFVMSFLECFFSGL